MYVRCLEAEKFLCNFVRENNVSVGLSCRCQPYLYWSTLCKPFSLLASSRRTKKWPSLHIKSLWCPCCRCLRCFCWFTVSQQTTKPINRRTKWWVKVYCVTWQMLIFGNSKTTFLYKYWVNFGHYRCVHVVLFIALTKLNWTAQTFRYLLDYYSI